MIRIAVCDDEQYWCDKINEYIFEYAKDFEIEIHSEKFLSCESLISLYLSGSSFDIIFLDIEFKNDKSMTMNGIELGRKLRNLYMDDNTAIIYVTSFREYAIDSIKIRPFDYIEKPVTYKKLMEVINQFRDSKAKERKVFTFISDKLENSVIVSNIRYFESLGRKVKIHTINNSYEFYGKLSDIINQECLSNFISIHKSFFVNVNYIEKFTSNSVVLYGTNSIELPISKNKKAEVSEKLLRR